MKNLDKIDITQYPENFRSIHDEMIAIDAAGPLLGFPPNGKLLVDPWDLYKKGGADIVFTTVSSLSLEENTELSDLCRQAYG